MPTSPVNAAAGVSPFSQYTQSARTIAQLQAQFGTMQPNKLQALRKQFYSFISYPLVGSNQLNFFGQAVGNSGATLEDTNMPVQGSFGTSAMLIKAIYCSYKLFDYELVAYDGLDANCFEVELLNGLFNAGVLTLTVNAKDYAQIQFPFLQAPPADGRTHMYNVGGPAANTWGPADVALSSRCENRYICDPEIFIAAQQNFACSISYPSGQIPIRSTGIVTAGNPLRVGVILDGIEFRPVS